MLRSKFFPVAISIVLICLICGCSDSPNIQLGDLNPNYFTCLSYECHQGTQLQIFSPVSGLHTAGMSPDCESCHYRYYTNPLHKNGFVDGYNWIYNIHTPGNIAFYGPDVPSTAFWDKATGTCGGFSCHGETMDVTDQWY